MVNWAFKSSGRYIVSYYCFMIKCSSIWGKHLQEATQQIFFFCRVPVLAWLDLCHKISDRGTDKEKSNLINPHHWKKWLHVTASLLIQMGDKHFASARSWARSCSVRKRRTAKEAVSWNTGNESTGCVPVYAAGLNKKKKKKTRNVKRAHPGQESL